MFWLSWNIVAMLIFLEAIAPNSPLFSQNGSRLSDVAHLAERNLFKKYGKTYSRIVQLHSPAAVLGLLPSSPLSPIGHA